MTNGPAGPGPGVDAQGLPVIDPTVNVSALVEAGLRRQDDLRQQEYRSLRHEMKLRASHYGELRKLEASRIDAIRAVDQGQITRAAEVQLAQAATLATQVVTSAEALRTQVAATATAAQIALGTALEPIQKDIADLRRAQYEQQGQRVAQTENRDGNQWLVGLIVSVIFGLVSVATLAVYIATHH